jgi:hypothetical protein
MVTRTATGQRIIRYPRPIRASRPVYDPWPAHAVTAHSNLWIVGHSGTVQLGYSQFHLRDGSLWNYPFGESPVTDFPQIWKDALAFQAMEIGGFHEGESYNFIVRPAAYAKWTNAERDAWQAAH